MSLLTEDIKFPSVMKDSKRSIAFRDKTPLHKTMVTVCAWPCFDDTTNETTVKFTEPLDVRWYWGSGATCRCIVWFRDRQLGSYGYGVGSAGGYGYDKESASFHAAVKDLGIEGTMPGGGHYSADVVCRTIAEAMGYKYIRIVEGHR